MKVEVAVLGSPSLIVLMISVAVDSRATFEGEVITRETILVLKNKTKTHKKGSIFMMLLSIYLLTRNRGRRKYLVAADSSVHLLSLLEFFHGVSAVLMG